jgi:hypothetical protein
MNNGQGYNEDIWGGGHMNYQRGAPQNGNRFGYGANQQRWNSGNNGGRDGYQNRLRTTPNGAVARGVIDADLLQQTVQAVVAAVTAAQKVPEAGGMSQVRVTVGSKGAPNQEVVVSIAAPAVVQQQGEVVTQEERNPQVAAVKGKENEGSGPSKKKKEEKKSCFRCKKLGHYIDDCPTPYCDLCESVNHTTSACHLIHAPKPTATIHGYANEALMFLSFHVGLSKPRLRILS